MVTAALFHNRHKVEIQCPSTDKWIKEMWYIHITEKYSTIKRTEGLIHAIMDEPGNIILSERDKSQKATYYMIPLI